MKLTIRHIPADHDSAPKDHYEIDLSSLVGDITLDNLATTAPLVTASGQLANLCREARLAGSGRWILAKVSLSGITCYAAGTFSQDYRDIDAEIARILARYLGQPVEMTDHARATSQAGPTTKGYTTPVPSSAASVQPGVPSPTQRRPIDRTLAPRPASDRY